MSIAVRHLRALWLLLPLLALFLVLPLALADGPPVVHGLAPLPNDQPVPLKDMPPGSSDGDPGPSEGIFPHQRITLRFNHAKHLSSDIGATCKTCHGPALQSRSSNDHLIPRGVTCDACHSTDHTDLSSVKPGDDAMGQCAFCHQGYTKEDGNKVAPLEMPRANLQFSHKAHIDRNIGCPQCHGAIDQIELATRDQLPRMRGCFRCHQGPDAASRGQAKSACDTCHVRGDVTPAPVDGETGAKVLRGTRIQTMFTSGTLTPPRWMHNAEHTPDWLERHKRVAADDSSFCANCHKEDFCTDCHDGRVRPRSIHPSDYLNLHPIEARMSTEKCTSCHREQSFCLDCHLRVGVSESSPPSQKDSGRFHPPKAIWSDPPRRPGHHSFEAERNLNACVSCHVERDCVTCHGAKGVGAGYDPHQNGFLAGCGAQMRKNPRPCFVCHQPSDPGGELAQCR